MPRVDACAKVVTLPQYTGTCWFNALLMSLFYSQNSNKMMRHILKGFKSHYKGSKPHMRIHALLHEIVTKLQKAKNSTERESFYKYFETVKPEHILELLHKFNKDKFPFDPVLFEGFSIASYLPVLNSFLNIKMLFLDSSMVGDKLEYYISSRNIVEFYYHEDKLLERFSFPSDMQLQDMLNIQYDSICVIHYGKNYNYAQKYKCDIDEKKKDGQIVSHTIKYRNSEFQLDSCCLVNFSKEMCSANHMIAGITCNKRQYVYNGWITSTRDAAMGKSESQISRQAYPCELMPYEWNNDVGDFCINPSTCKLDRPINKKGLCFSFDKGERYFIYINKNFSKPKYNHEYFIDIETNQLPEVPRYDEKVLSCIRKVANWSSLSPVHKFDSRSFDPNIFLKDMVDASPKLINLLTKIKNQDELDMKIHGHKFKHFLFSDVTHGYGAKIITSALIALGYDLAYDDKHKLKQKGKRPRFALLSSSTIYGEPMTQKSKKAILTEFNMRPNNVYGDSIQIIILDSGFKEGIDLFDVKYIHVFEPQLSRADLKQVIGRATRYCGQNGLEFNSKTGWPLEVTVYDSQLPQVIKDRKYNVETLHELYMNGMGNDIRELYFADELEKIFAIGAVDYELNKLMHGFKKNAVVPLQKSILKQYGKTGKWQVKEFKNMCNENAETFLFKPHQEFLRNYVQVQMPVHGILVNHSVGSGKTCSAIAAASNTFEKNGYTVLWVTRTTLKTDLYKNMFDQVCNSNLQHLKMPKEITARKKLLSKSWQIPPMSYKQFTNMLQGKNSFYKRLVAINGKEDPLKNSLLIIDEAHKLFNATDLKPMERPDMNLFQKMLQNSYTKSGKNAVRSMLMTATPITNSPMDAIKLINLLKDKRDALPEQFDEFSSKYLDAKGKFSKEGTTQFLKSISGYVSYLDMSKDGTHFAQPDISQMKVPISFRKMLQETKEQVKFKHGIHIRDLKRQLNDISKEHDELKAAYKIIKEFDKKTKKEKDENKIKKELNDLLLNNNTLAKFIRTTSFKTATVESILIAIENAIILEKEKISSIKSNIASDKSTMAKHKIIVENDKSQERMLKACMDSYQSS